MCLFGLPLETEFCCSRVSIRMFWIYFVFLILHLCFILLADCVHRLRLSEDYKRYFLLNYLDMFHHFFIFLIIFAQCLTHT